MQGTSARWLTTAAVLASFFWMLRAAPLFDLARGVHHRPRGARGRAAELSARRRDVRGVAASFERRAKMALRDARGDRARRAGEGTDRDRDPARHHSGLLLAQAGSKDLGAR